MLKKNRFIVSYLLFNETGSPSGITKPVPGLFGHWKQVMQVAELLNLERAKSNTTNWVARARFGGSNRVGGVNLTAAPFRVRSNFFL
jgi:hypothetical protein